MRARRLLSILLFLVVVPVSAREALEGTYYEIEVETGKWYKVPGVSYTPFHVYDQSGNLVTFTNISGELWVFSNTSTLLFAFQNDTASPADPFITNPYFDEGLTGWTDFHTRLAGSTTCTASHTAESGDFDGDGLADEVHVKLTVATCSYSARWAWGVKQAINLTGVDTLRIRVKMYGTATGYRFQVYDENTSTKLYDAAGSTSWKEIDVNVSSLAGVHILQIRGDTYNYVQNKAYDIWLDHVSPNPTYSANVTEKDRTLTLSSPADGAVLYDANVTLSWLQSPVLNTTVELNMANGTSVNSSAGNSTWALLAEGRNYWRVIHPIYGATAWRSVVVDEKLPPRPSMTAPTQGEDLASNAVQVNWSVSSTQDIDQFRVVAYSASPFAIISQKVPATATTATLVLPWTGDWTIYVVSVDPAGNEVSSDQVTVHVQAPPVDIINLTASSTGWSLVLNNTNLTALDLNLSVALKREDTGEVLEWQNQSLTLDPATPTAKCGNWTVNLSETLYRVEVYASSGNLTRYEARYLVYAPPAETTAEVPPSTTFGDWAALEVRLPDDPSVKLAARVVDVNSGSSAMSSHLVSVPAPSGYTAGSAYARRVDVSPPHVIDASISGTSVSFMAEALDPFRAAVYEVVVEGEELNVTTTAANETKFMGNATWDVYEVEIKNPTGYQVPVVYLLNSSVTADCPSCAVEPGELRFTIAANSTFSFTLYVKREVKPVQGIVPLLNNPMTGLLAVVVALLAVSAIRPRR